MNIEILAKRKKSVKACFFLSRHIPLIPRRPTSSQELQNKKAAAKKPKNPEERSPTPPDDPDEKLIFESHKKACSYINEMVSNKLNRKNQNRSFDFIIAHS